MENPPQNPIFQSDWDRPVAESTFNFLLQTAPSEAERARLLSISAESASDWLHAIPIPSLGLQLDPMSLKIACGLHLGSPLCHQHKCICSVVVEANGRHGLSCNRQTGRYSRHAQIIEIIKRSLPQQSQLDYRPDGLTMTTWKQG